MKHIIQLHPQTPQLPLHPAQAPPHAPLTRNSQHWQQTMDQPPNVTSASSAISVARF